MDKVVEDAKVRYQIYSDNLMEETLDYLEQVPQIFTDAILLAADSGETYARVILKYAIPAYVSQIAYRPLGVKYIGEVTVNTIDSPSKRIVIGYEYEISFEI